MVTAFLALSGRGTADSSSEGEATAFVVRLALSEVATAALTELGESAVLMVDYYGWPRTEAADEVDDVGRIVLVPYCQLGIPARSGEYPIPAVRFDRLRVGQLAGAIFVTVGVASARISGPDNLLHCDSFDLPLAEAKREIQTIRCGLIEGDPGDPLSSLPR